MSQLHWDPVTYLAQMRTEVPQYQRLQHEAVAATGAGARRVLELGTGTDETALRVLRHHPDAAVVGLDASADMLAHARAILPPAPVERRVVVADVVVPADPADVVTPIDGEYDTPSAVAEQLRWLREADLRPTVAWAHRDLAVIVGRARGATGCL